MTFNHEPFIRQAMDSIMMQKTNFKVEVVVGDDFSTDSTLEIIKEYTSTENIHINILQRTIGDSYWKKRQQLGRLYNFSNILENCNGKYVALLDGDDYWTDPLKIQKQIDFLEKNKDYVISFHDAKVVDADDKFLKPHKLKKSIRRDRNPEENVSGMEIPALSVVFRKYFLKKLPNSFHQVKNGDTFLMTFIGQNGKSKFQSDIIPAAYRVHSGGIWSTLNSNEKIIDLYNTYLCIYQVIDNPNLNKMLRRKLFIYSLQSSLLLNGIGNRVYRYISSYKLLSLTKDDLVGVMEVHKSIFKYLIIKQF